MFFDNRNNFKNTDIYLKKIQKTRFKLLKYKGVNYNKERNKWIVFYKSKYFGTYNLLEDAIEVYDNFLTKDYGENAITNKFLISIGRLPEIPNDNIKQIKVDDLPNEEWRDVKNYEGHYKVSNLGRIKGIIISLKGILLEENLRAFSKTKGYYTVPLYKNNIAKSYRINRLVAQAFIPNPYNLPQVNHKNLNKLDNQVENLEWCDQSYNMQHARINKIFSKPLGNRKINEIQAKEIKDLWKTGKYTQDKIGKMYNLAGSTISYIVNNKRWKEIQ